jgi:hypothetical protein
MVLVSGRLGVSRIGDNSSDREEKYKISINAARLEVNHTIPYHTSKIYMERK